MPRCLCISPCHALLGQLVSLPLLVCNITFSPLSSKYFQKNSVHFNIKKINYVEPFWMSVLHVEFFCQIFQTPVLFQHTTAFSCSSLYSEYKFMTFALKSSFQIIYIFNANNIDGFSFPKKMVL